MILFAGIPSEPPLALAISSARRQGIPYLVLNQRHSAHNALGLHWRDGRLGGGLIVGSQAHPIDAFTGIYARTVEPATLPEFTRAVQETETAAVQRILAFTELLNDMLDIAPCRVVNRPLAMGSNISKPYQTQLIAQFGLRVPETLVTNDPAQVRAFHTKHGRIIYKSISSVRSIVREWRPANGDNVDLERLAELPTQFQAFIPGTDVRVHTVGTKLFATEITSEAIDYRYAGRQGLEVRMQPIELPDWIASTCVELTSELGLAMGGIDLRRTPEGAWYCFEINPSPAYSFYQEHTGHPIADALVKLLWETGKVDAPKVQIVENQAEVTGELLSVTPDTERPGYVRLSVRIDTAAPVTGYPNLMTSLVGTTVIVITRADSIIASTPGPISFRARRTGSGIFAN